MFSLAKSGSGSNITSVEISGAIEDAQNQPFVAPKSEGGGNTTSLEMVNKALKALEDKKKQAVLEEDYLEANRLKDVIQNTKAKISEQHHGAEVAEETKAEETKAGEAPKLENPLETIIRIPTSGHEVMVHIKHATKIEYEIWGRTWAGCSHGTLRKE